MEEKDLIAKLTLLKDVRPRENWVLLVKTRILEGSNPVVSSALYPAAAGALRVFRNARVLASVLFSATRYMGRPAYVLPILLVFVFGGVTLQASKNSLPGDALFSLKSAFEKATLSFAPESERQLLQLGLAQKRLEDLRKIAQENKVRNLSETIKEFKASVGEVSKGFSALVEKEPSKAVQAGRELVQLQKDKAAVEQVLGTAIGEEESSEIYNTTKTLVESELTYLLNHTLTEEQRILLREALLDYQAEDYEMALEKIWKISN